MKKAVITNIKKNVLGTISFNFKGVGMRKEQEFITYPINRVKDTVGFQSDKRYMVLNLKNMELNISNKGNTSWLFYLNGYKKVDIDLSEIENLLNHIRGTTNSKAGLKENGIIMCDNSSAHLI